MSATLELTHPRPRVLQMSAPPNATPALRAQPPTSSFRITCQSAQVHLRLAHGDGTGARFFKMKLQHPGRWGLTLTLVPGIYRYRYYADDGQVTTYVSPRDADDSAGGPATAMEGLDAILFVSEHHGPTRWKDNT